MLLKIVSFEGIHGRKLMDLYQEGNIENAEFFYPDMEDRALALQKCEEDFLEFVRTKFFRREGSEYWILEEGGVWVSALRLNRIEAGHYYIEALETHPEYREKGYATRLLGGVIENLKSRGPFRLSDCVSKKNEPSVRTHRKCGFAIVPGAAVDYLNHETSEKSYGMEYRFPDEGGSLE